MREPLSRRFDARGLSIHYAEWPNPGAPPLVLLHGGRDHCRSWDWVADELAADWHIIAPDLRGHGDSAHSPDGHYSLEALVIDFWELVRHIGTTPLTIVGHSLGGNVVLRYAGLYPENVRRLVAIEGLGPSPKMRAEREAIPMHDRMRGWIEADRKGFDRAHRRYASIEEALARMMAANPHLDEARARHLTVHAVRQLEDGGFVWKYDPRLPFMGAETPMDFKPDEMEALWRRVSCPTLLVYGADSWASNPEKDGRAAHFSDARVSVYERAGHWVHHDRQDAFVEEIRSFLG